MQTYGIGYIAMLTLFYLSPQTIQSARLSFPSSELAVLLLPPLSPRGETHPLKGGGGWGTQFRRRVFYSMYTVFPPVTGCCSSSEWWSYYTVVKFGLRDCSFIRILQTRPEGGGERGKGCHSSVFLFLLTVIWSVTSTDPLGGGVHSACIIFSMRSQKTSDRTISSSVIYLQYSSVPYSHTLYEKFLKKLMLQASF